ncbi:hypothetical protein [Acidocella facilis]|uniref:hypothetical protein n=1 Tax=Acidocella facilis TaxID=525 RepID=UPI001F465EE0|nr:hypothetical protein [Acidocella facilis]
MSNKNRHLPPPQANAAPPVAAVKSGRGWLKPAMIAAFVPFSLVCVAAYLQRAQSVQNRLLASGYSPYPGGNDSDLDLFWKHGPGHVLMIAGADQVGPGMAIFLVAFTLYFTLVAWVLRGTFMPYLVAVAVVVLNVLCTGAFLAPPDVALRVSVNQDRGVISDGSTPVALCDVRALSVEARDAVRGGASYWIVGHLRTGGTVDLSVFDNPAIAADVLASLQTAMQAKSCL